MRKKCRALWRERCMRLRLFACSVCECVSVRVRISLFFTHGPRAARLARAFVFKRPQHGNHKFAINVPIGNNRTSGRQTGRKTDDVVVYLQECKRLIFCTSTLHTLTYHSSSNAI